MDDELLVVIEGLQLFGRPGLGPFSIVKDGLDGWDDGVAMRGSKVDRAQAHGSRTLPRYQGSRTVTINGIILAGSAAEQERAGHRISGLLVDGGTGRIQITKGGLSTWAECSRENTSVDKRRGGYKSDFQIELWCPDPRKFGDTQTFVASVGAPVDVYHWGNCDAAPSFVVAGSMPGGYALWVGGQPFYVTRPLVSGSPHSITYNDGRLRIGGTVIHGGLGSTTTPGIRPGAVVSVSIAPITTGTATATLTLLDTYI